MMKSVSGFLPLLFFLCSGILYGQSLPLTEKESGTLAMDLRPGIGIPVGESSDYWSSAFTGSLGLNYEFPSVAVLVGGGIDYGYHSTDAGYKISVLGATVRSGYRFRPIPRLPIDLTVTGGFSYGSPHTESANPGTTWNLGAGTAVGFLLTPGIDLAVWGDYRYHFGLYQGISFGIQASFYLTGKDRREGVARSRCRAPHKGRHA